MKDKLIEELEKLTEMFSESKRERKAFVFMPSNDGFSVYEVDEETGQNAITIQLLRDKAKNKTNQK